MISSPTLNAVLSVKFCGVDSFIFRVSNTLRGTVRDGAVVYPVPKLVTSRPLTAPRLF